VLQLLGKLLFLLQQTFATILEGTCSLCFLLQLLHMLLQMMYSGCCLQSRLSGKFAQVMGQTSQQKLQTAPPATDLV